MRIKKPRKNIYNLAKSIYCSKTLNYFRHIKDPILIKFRYKNNLRNNKNFKLHLGCGPRHFDGYENIDVRKTRATDVVCDIKKLPYPNNSVKLIEAYHVIEHLTKNNALEMFKECNRILIPNGKLIIECPNFDEAVKEYLNGNEKRLDNIFGLHRQTGDTHLFGYNFKRLKNILEKIGFSQIEEKTPQDSHSKKEPCLRIECVK